MQGSTAGVAAPSRRPFSLLFQTLASIIFSVITTSGLMFWTLGADLGAQVMVLHVWRMGLAIAVVAPALISPLLAFRAGQWMRKLQQAHDRMEDMAKRDMLTGLLNRRGLQLAAAGLAQGAPVGFLLADADRFKAINDAHGHDAGDLALIHIASVLRETVRVPGAALGRHGGEEFAILLPGLGLRETQAVAEALRAACEASPVPREAGPLRITLSLGAAARFWGEGALDALMSEADRALYEAKHAGRNRVVAALPRAA